jgi:hypothetical protein
MAAFDDQHQVAGRRRIAGREMKIDPEFVAHHPLGISHVLGRIEPEGSRKRMQDRPAMFGFGRRRGGQDVVEVPLSDSLASERGVRALATRAEAPAGHVDDDAADLDPRHPLGRVDREPSGVLRRLKIDHRAAFDPARALVADAEHLASVGAPAQRVGRLHRV